MTFASPFGWQSAGNAILRRDGERGAPGREFSSIMASGTGLRAFPWLSRLFASFEGTSAAMLVFDGDSISVGVGASPGRTLAEQVASLLPAGVATRVVGASGRPVKDCLARYDVDIRPLYDAGRARNVIFLHAGDNDITQGSNARQAYDALTAYVARAHRQGWSIVVSTELQRFDLSEAMRAELSAFNALVLANAAGADGVADFGGDATMGGVANRRNPTYYTLDGVHPSDAGYAILAGLTARAVLPRLAAP